MRHEILEEITDALQYAERQEPKPPLDTMFEDVYSDVPWHLREQQAELDAEIAKHGPKTGHDRASTVSPKPEARRPKPSRRPSSPDLISSMGWRKPRHADARNEHHPGGQRCACGIEMRRDPRVVVLGEDVGKFGGVFRATSGLHDEFGADRVIDTPLAEAGIIGTAIGMALYGLRPVPEIQFADFIYPGVRSDRERAGQVALSLGRPVPAPVVIRTPVGGGIRGGHYHSQSPEALFIHTPGLKVVCPSNPYDAKGLLATCIRGEDPVIFMEPKRVYRAAQGRGARGRVHRRRSARPRSCARARRSRCSRWGAMVHTGVEAAEQGAAQGYRSRGHRPAHAAAVRHRRRS